MSSEFMLCDKISELTDVNLKYYIGEWKLDGERIQALKIGNKIQIYNRRGREKKDIYVEVFEELKKLDFDFIVDSEVITYSYLFNDLQHRSNCNPTSDRLKEYPVKMVIFDILFFKGEDLRNLPLMERKKYLESFKELKNVEVLDWFEGEKIKELWDWVNENNKEGIILKKKNSLYEYKRSKNWLKLKCWKYAKLSFYGYEVNDNSTITIYNDTERCLVARDIKKIKKEIDENGKVDIKIRYLEKTKNNKYRFITYGG